MEIEEPSDYTLVDMDYDLSKRKSFNNYLRLLKKISNNILTNEGIQTSIDKLLLKGPMGRGITDDQVESYVVRMTEQIQPKKWNDLAKQDKDEYLRKLGVAATYRALGFHHRQFSGFADLAFLSSGIIRQFLELCGMAYYFASQDNVDLKNGEFIKPEYQNEAVWAVSNYYLATVRKNIARFGPSIQQFIIDLGDIFRYRLLYGASALEAARVSIVDPHVLNTPELRSTRQIVDSALLHSVIQSPAGGLGGDRPTNISQEQPQDLILNRIYAPVMRYSPRARWRINMRTSDVQGLLDSGNRGKVKSEIIRKISGVSIPETDPFGSPHIQMKLFDSSETSNDGNGTSVR